MAPSLKGIKMSKAQEIKAATTTAIIEALMRHAENPVAWKRPWALVSAPHNAATQRRYNGVNVLILAVAAASNRYETGAWLTYKQAQEMGAQVRKGEKSTKVLFYSPCAKKAAKDGEDPDVYMVAKTFAVFNAAQIDGLDLMPSAPQAGADTALALCEALGVELVFGGDSAHYTPATDAITLPKRDQFEADQLALVLMHELGHWTGRRVGRDQANEKASAGYALEELVAELFAAHISARLGLAASDEPNEHAAQHAAYIGHWIALLKGDPDALFKANALALEALAWVEDRAPSFFE